MELALELVFYFLNNDNLGIVIVLVLLVVVNLFFILEERLAINIQCVVRDCEASQVAVGNFDSHLV